MGMTLAPVLHHPGSLAEIMTTEASRNTAAIMGMGEMLRIIGVVFGWCG
jgi:hypothetical protein